MSGKRVQFAGDVEGHVGRSDARFYLLDLQRCFPAEEPSLCTSAVLVPTSSRAAVTPLADVNAMSGRRGVPAKTAWSEVLNAVAPRLHASPETMRAVPLLDRRAWIVTCASAEQAHANVNERLSELAGARIVGDGVLVVFYG